MLIKKHEKKIIPTHMGQVAREEAEKKIIQNLIIPNDGAEFEV